MGRNVSIETFAYIVHRLPVSISSRESAEAIPCPVEEVDHCLIFTVHGRCNV